MTHAELYKIVKDHQDVWGSILEFVPNTVGGGSFLEHDGKHFVDLSPGRFMAEFTLLGLGVAWLVQNGCFPALDIAPEGFPVCWAEPEHGHDCDPMSRKGYRGSSILAAVYAAIGEVKEPRP